MAYAYGIPDGTYVGKPVTASCYEKDGELILDINFAVKDPSTGTWYKKDNGYEWEVKKRHWLTSSDGAFNEKTIEGLKEWAKGWQPRSLDDFWWFQSPDANGTPFGNLLAVGEVELNFQTNNQGNQNIWVHDPNRQRTGRKAWTPPEANTDRAAMMAKWGSKAKALFAATPKKVATVAAAKAAQAAPAASAPSAGVSAPHAAPTRPAASARPVAAPTAAKPSDFPQDADGAFSFFCARLKEHGEKYASAKHDGRWFEIFDSVANGQDPDLFTPQETESLFQAVDKAFAK